MADTEQRLRVQLAACYRIFDYLGWTESIYNHITVKLPGEHAHFLINPYGLHFSEVCASNLIKVDIDGQIVEPSEYPVNPAGMLIHSAIHGARGDTRCIAHTHTDAGMAVACQARGLRHENFYSALMQGQIAYHPFEGITVLDGEKQRLIANLGDKNLLILRNHGLLSCGRSIPEAYQNLWGLQRACEIQVATDACSEAIMQISAEVLETAEQVMKIQTMGQPSGQLEFDAMQRIVDKIDPSYRE